MWYVISAVAVVVYLVFCYYVGKSLAMSEDRNENPFTGDKYDD